MVVSKKERIYTAIDIGTTKVATLVCRMGPGGIEILAAGHSRSEGMQKGLVVEPDLLKQSVSASVKDAESLLGKRLSSAHIGVTGAHLSCANAEGSFTSNSKTNQPKSFTLDDVDTLLKSTAGSSLPGQQLVQIIPRSFVVDGVTKVLDPVGIKGSRLSVESHVVVGDSEPLESLARVIRSAGIEIKSMVLEHLASAEAVLTANEKETGVILVDIGGGTSDMVVYKNGSIWYTNAIPVAGQHFTSDIVTGLGLLPSIAESTKVNYGSALTEGVDNEAAIEVETGLGGHTRFVSQLALNRLIRDRATELARMIMHKLAETGLKHLPPAGIVLTGGSAALPGIIEIVAEQGKCPVRLGAPSHALGLPGELEHSSFSTAIGLLLWTLKHKHAGTFVPSIKMSERVTLHAKRLIARLEMEQPTQIKV